MTFVAGYQQILFLIVTFGANVGGTPIQEKSYCPRVKEKLAELGPCCASCVNLCKERPFDQQEWFVCARDVNGVATIENIKHGILTSDIYEKTDCFAWSIGDE